MKTRLVVSILALLVFYDRSLAADQLDDARMGQLRTLSSRLKYQSGQIHLRDGLATLHLTDSFRYLDPAGSETLLTGIWGNPSSGEKPLGVIVPADFDPFDPVAWAVVMEYSEDGYVPDHDAETLNYTELLTDMKEQARAASEERVKDGYPSVELVGWAAAPRYDKQSHKFYWAKEIKFGDSEGENTLNYNVRILGRRGILVLNAVSSMSQLAEIEQATPALLQMVEFNTGHRYADYNPSTDKMASYGLAALVAGGVAAKSGLLKGLLVTILAMKKVLIVAAIALFGLARKFFSRKATAS